jgi:glycine/D-amino acid oxidase-like deaminating enzyme
MNNIAEGAIWDSDVKMRRFPALSQSIEADVVIVGGGITGITAAYLLSGAGLSVVLLEKNRIGFGATGLTTAFLTQYLDTDISELIAMFGSKKTHDILDSHAEAINIVESIVTKERIDCDFMRCSNYIYANNEQALRDINKEQAAASKIGLEVKLWPEGKLPFKNSGSLELPNQAKFQPLKYLSSLVDILVERGVQIFEDTEVTTIEGEDSVTVITTKAQVKAKQVLVATYVPFDKELFFKKAYYTSYVYEATLPANVILEGTYEDTSAPYHYFRVDHLKDKDRLIIGGSDHRSDVPVNKSKSWQALEDYIHQTFGAFPLELHRRWSGPIVEPVDGLAYIGPVKKKNIYYATGFSGNGMTYSVIAAKIVMDLILGKESSWLALYNPLRHTSLLQMLYKGRDYGLEFIGGALRNTLKYRRIK